MNELWVDIENNRYTDTNCGMSIGYEQKILDATVWVDGSDLINHFNVTFDCKWVELQRIRNQITIIVKKNNTFEDRNCVIKFTHNLDTNLYIKLNIYQSACEYTITVDKDRLLFETLLDYNDPESTDVTINVTTMNGICDFGVGSITEYVRNFDFTSYLPGDIIFEDDVYYVKNDEVYDKGDTITTFPYTVQPDDEYYYYEVQDMYRPTEIIHEGQKYWTKVENIYQLYTATEDIVVSSDDDKVYYRWLKDRLVAYDNGLKLYKVSKNKLQITNYGKICLDDDFYYIITLYHINNPRNIAQIRIDYVDSFVNNESGFDLDDDEQDN